ncbi:conserved hypothetical protein [uncultured Mycobacterium sp.]|uniref:Uncharacterized protein n=1 Tax=uncultured Mycobacterium sp. TaxID=171292 RepID=A0A1Y5P544_9MYCO|nr:conserved hypothetical protein [uncultured Mycobacterium sp.]
MAWFQVDDQLAMHRKVCEAGNAAMGLWVRAGSWAMANLTEGFVPTSAARTLGSKSQADALVKAGLWVVVDGGYQFHEWGTRQMSAEQIAERRRKRAEAGRKGGQSKRPPSDEAKPEANGQANALASAKHQLEQNGTPVPVPVLSVVTREGNETLGNASDSTNDPPSEFCKRHPNGTDERCGGCRNARQRAEAWHDEQAAAASAAIVRRRQEIRDCPDCDDNGLVDVGNGVTRCPQHDWSLTNA